MAIPQYKRVSDLTSIHSTSIGTPVQRLTGLVLPVSFPYHFLESHSGGVGLSNLSKALLCPAESTPWNSGAMQEDGSCHGERGRDLRQRLDNHSVRAGSPNGPNWCLSSVACWPWHCQPIRLCSSRCNHARLTMPKEPMAPRGSRSLAGSMVG